MARNNPLSYLGVQLDEWRGAGTYQQLRELQSSCGPVSKFDGKEVINLASNNMFELFLGRTTASGSFEGLLSRLTQQGSILNNETR